MATLQEQLEDIEKQEQEHKLLNPHMSRLSSILHSAENLGCLSSIIFICSTLFILFNVFKNIKTDDWIVIIFYGGIFLGVYLAKIISELIERLAYRIFKVTKEELSKEKAIRNAFTQKINYIKNEIKKEEDAKRKVKEQAFILRLNHFINKLESTIVQKEEIDRMVRELKKDNIEIGRSGYQIHTKEFYDKSFKKIQQIIEKPNSQHSSKLTDLSNISEATNVTPKSPQDVQLPSTKIINDQTSKKQLSVNQYAHSTKNIASNLEEPSFLSVNVNLQKEHFVEEKTAFELFEKGRLKSTDNRSNLKNPASKIDYLKLQENRQTIGLLGELFAFEWEKRRLSDSQNIFVDKMLHVSENNDSLGYDILSFNEDGTPKFIEVKTTTDNYYSPFYLTETEIVAMEKSKNYFIYRIYDFNLETKRGSILIIDCSIDIDKYFKLQPASYKVFPK